MSRLCVLRSRGRGSVLRRGLLAALVMVMLAGVVPGQPAVAQTPAPAGPVTSGPLPPGLAGAEAWAGNPPPKVPAPVIDPSAVLPAPPVTPGPVPGQEILERRTADSKTFATDEADRYTTNIANRPVHFRDGGGAWVDIDSELAPVIDGRRQSKANSFIVEVAEYADDAALGRLRLDASTSVSFALEGAATVKATASADEMTYVEVKKDTDLRLASRPGGLKEDIVLKGPAAPTTFVFPLSLQGLTASVDEGGDVVYRDSGGAERARTPAGFMVDSSGDPRSGGEGAMSTGVAYRLVPRAEGVALEVTLDQAWLADPARVWPVVVDPPFNAYVPDSASDTYVMSGFRRNSSADADLKVGTYDGGAHIGRTFLRFPNLSAMSGKTINSATFKIYENWSWSCSPRRVDIYRATADWNGADLLDYPGAPTGEYVTQSTFAMGYCGGGWASFDVRQMVANIAGSVWGNFGIMLKAASETDNYNWKKFHSFDRGGDSFPVIQVDYTEPARPPAIPSGVTPADGTILGTSTSTVSAVYSDPDGGSGNMAFGVWDANNQLQWSEWSGAVCSGCRATLNVPALPDNRYYVRVIAWDGAHYSSDWSAPQWFNIDTRPPAASELTPTNGATGSAPTDVSARYTEPNGLAGYLYFWLYTTDGAVVIEQWTGPWASGSVGSLTVPNLAPGTYNVWAMPWDTRQYGPQIGPNTFTVQTLPTTTTTPPSTTTTTVEPTTTTTTPPSTTTTTVEPTTTTVPPTTTTVPSTTTTVPRVEPLDPPLNPVGTVIGPRTARVTWTPPQGNDSPITGYSLIVTPECAQCEGTDVVGNTPEATVRGLSPFGSPYTFVVIARNERGQTSRSVPSPALTIPADKYAVMGDSYSSGEGTANDAGPCQQSPNAYGPYYADILALAIPDVTFTACTGVTTQHLVGTQLPAVPSEAALMTFTIGGNDVGYGDVLIGCTILPSCQERYSGKEQEIAELQPVLVQTYRAALGRAPEARVIVLSYPQIFSDGFDACTTDAVSIDPAEKTWLRERTAQIEGVIRAAVDEIGNPRLSLLPVLNSFAGHEICTSNEYANGLSIEAANSYHPNSAGHQKLATDLESHLAQIGWYP